MPSLTFSLFLCLYFGLPWHLPSLSLLSLLHVFSSRIIFLSCSDLRGNLIIGGTSVLSWTILFFL
ncbi:hypothetical protein J3E69DRAFT_347277 [Trichoderma sp. SZMC 28015]